MKTINTYFFYSILLSMILLVSCKPLDLAQSTPDPIEEEEPKKKEETKEENDYNNDGTIVIKGKIETSRDYCGGAAPPPQILEEYKKKKPLIAYQLYIKAGKQNDLNTPIVDSTSTNRLGEFEFYLNPGDYILLSQYQINKDIFGQYKDSEHYKVDMNCLEDWWKNGISQITVEEQSNEDLYFHFHQSCFLPLNVPCMMFLGPYPP